jgi:NADPH2:quinone reductase
MNAAFIHQTGPPEAIVYGDLPLPQPAGTQVRVKVGAVALNPIDTYIRSGLVKMDLPSPFIVGCDLAGVVEATGPDARRFKVGDRVWGTNQGLMGRQGTFAEFAVVDDAFLYPTPSAVSDEAAAAIALVGITAHLGLVQNARLQSGETIFVNGGSGGVGSTVIQMARALGARVMATAGTAEKVSACRQLGADVVIKLPGAECRGRAEKDRARRRECVVGDDARARLRPHRRRDGAAGAFVIMAEREARPAFPVGPFLREGSHLARLLSCSWHAGRTARPSAEAHQSLAGGRTTQAPH